MIEICVDIANHIVADRKYRVPFSYADTFKVLQEEGIINAELSGNMERMARFRNILVHHYNKLDASTMVTLLREQLEDFLRYKDSILRTLTWLVSLTPNLHDFRHLLPTICPPGICCKLNFLTSWFLPFLMVASKRQIRIHSAVDNDLWMKNLFSKTL